MCSNIKMLLTRNSQSPFTEKKISLKMTAISFFLFIIRICAQFAPCKTPAALNIKSCQVFFQSLKMSFRAADAASCTRYWGTILIYNFAMEANRHGRYHRRQPPEKQINFFPPIPPSIQRDGQLSWNDVRVYWCWCELSLKYQRDGKLTVEMIRKSSCIYISW